MRLFTSTSTTRAMITTRRSLVHRILSTARLPRTITTIRNSHGNQIRPYSSSGPEKGTPLPPSPFSPPSHSQSSNFNPSTYLYHATTTLSNIPPKLIPDTLHLTQSHLLSLALSSYLPPICLPPGFNLNSHKRLPFPRPSKPEEEAALPPGYHLAYYPLQTPPHLLFPDGTDADHCPGAPFTRRMWAGGRIEFLPGSEEKLKVDGRKTICVETLGVPPLVQPGKGGGGKEQEQRVWVDVWRGYVTFSPDASGGEMERVIKGVVRDLDLQAGRQDGGTGTSPAGPKEGVISELRKLVFLREREPGSKLEPARVIRVPHPPDFFFTMTPDATLLFQFSALTFNAHAIHLDPLYAREVEGYKERLVHGPLTLVIMLRGVGGFLRGASTSGAASTGAEAGIDGGAGTDGIQISEAIRERLSVPPEEEGANKKKWEIANIEYRNLRPLFVGEEMKVCVRLLPNKQSKNVDAEAGLGGGGRKERVDVWIEAPDGGLAVKGTVGVELR